MNEHEETQQTDESTVATCLSCEEYLAGWKRAQADYANLKRETDERVRSASTYAAERLVDRLLPALDQLESAFAFAPATEGIEPEIKKRIDAWIAGVVAMKSTWDQSLASIGITRVDVDGLFDPMLHEAAGETSDETKPDQAIVRVMRSGWRMNGSVIRPATVIINSREHT